MSLLRDEITKQQFIYFPWVKERPLHGASPQLALHLRNKHRGRLTVVCPLKSSVPDELVKEVVVTERSGSVMDGGIVLAYCPTYKLMNKISHLKKSIIILVEWPTENFEDWARLVGAYNVATGEVMSTSLGDDGRSALDAILFEGYKGWSDDTAKRMTLHYLKKLRGSGQYDRGTVLTYMRQTKSEDSIKRLKKILDQFDQFA